jgi:hypothetical protein
LSHEKPNFSNFQSDESEIKPKKLKLSSDPSSLKGKIIKEKYEEQLSSRELTFSAPIPKEEK